MMRGLIVLLFCYATLGQNIPHIRVRRIVGGRAASIVTYPYQISFEYKKRHWCGGTLLAPNVILTAGHCPYNKTVSDLRIRAGSQVKGRGGQLSDIAEGYIHPKYCKKTHDYDVSVLRLATPLQFNENVQPISLQPINQSLPIGSFGTVIGFGKIESEGHGSHVLQEVEVSKVSTKNCQKGYISKITSRMTCYGDRKGERDACQGDSGGPLIFEDRQIGIVSWGTGCADPEHPGVYTNIGNEEIQNFIIACLNKFKL